MSACSIEPSAPPRSCANVGGGIACEIGERIVTRDGFSRGVVLLVVRSDNLGNPLDSPSPVSPVCIDLLSGVKWSGISVVV